MFIKICDSCWMSDFIGKNEIIRFLFSVLGRVGLRYFIYFVIINFCFGFFYFSYFIEEEMVLEMIRVIEGTIV